MKIAFIGTHGTGKTTLAHSLVTNLKKSGIDTGFLSEIARSCPFPINQETTKKSQIWIILNQIIKEIEAEDAYKIIVSDRSVLDGYCYYVRKFGRSKIIEPLIIEHLKTYDKLIYVPIRKGLLKKDKIRSTDSKFQKEVKDVFENLIKEFNLKTTIFNENAKNEKDLIENAIKNLN
jgi:adenylate kinase family enzyme